MHLGRFQLGGVPGDPDSAGPFPRRGHASIDPVAHGRETDDPIEDRQRHNRTECQQQDDCQGRKLTWKSPPPLARSSSWRDDHPALIIVPPTMIM